MLNEKGEVDPFYLVSKIDEPEEEDPQVEGEAEPEADNSKNESLEAGLQPDSGEES